MRSTTGQINIVNLIMDRKLSGRTFTSIKSEQGKLLRTGDETKPGLALTIENKLMGSKLTGRKLTGLKLKGRKLTGQKLTGRKLMVTVIRIVTI